MNLMNSGIPFLKPIRNPNYAIVKIPESANVVRFYQLLLEHGFAEVSFVNEVRENAFLPHSEMVVDSTLKNTKNFNEIRTMSPMGVHTMNNKFVNHSSTPENYARSCSSTLSVESASTGANNGLSIVNSIGNMNSLSLDKREDFPKIVTPSSVVATNGPVNLNARQRGLRTPGSGVTEDPIQYANCQLCNNRIMSSRLSNLTNHVRRHAALKQYQCAHCTYSHNEMAKVRLHMHHNHQDYSSQPVDTLTYEMQLQWNVLMEKCFPEHAKRCGTSIVTLQSRDLQMELPKSVDPENNYTCVECGEIVLGSNLLEHLNEAHRLMCIPFACSECGFQSASQWKVRQHIGVTHQDKAEKVQVITLSSGANYVLFLQRFFPSIPLDNEKMPDESKNKVGKSESDDVSEITPCQLCDDKKPVVCHPISSLLSHAKCHCPRKQFLCSECPYSCVERSAMQTHLSTKHSKSPSQEPINFLDEDLKVQWLETMKKCFPKFSSQINQYTFTDTDLNLERRGNSPPKIEETPITIELRNSSEESSTDSSTQQEDTLKLFGVQKLDLTEDESSTPPPLFDVQFNQEGCISKIRTLKRNSENSVEALNSTLLTNSRSPSPTNILAAKRRCRPSR